MAGRGRAKDDPERRMHVPAWRVLCVQIDGPTVYHAEKSSLPLAEDDPAVTWLPADRSPAGSVRLDHLSTRSRDKKGEMLLFVAVDPIPCPFGVLCPLADLFSVA